MSAIKIVFFDIDGTLVPWKSGRIPASVFESVAALRRKGIQFYFPIHTP